MSSPESSSAQKRAWYHGISRYHWLVLVIACAGWIFDVYEGQIFNITRGEMLKEILGPEADPNAPKFWGDVFLGVFLAGGTFGGLLFGSLADKYGRKPVMIATILCYSLFSGLTFFAQELWQVAALRFFVAAGVGGEWAVASSLVAEVFPKHARTHASGIFHASSVLGTWCAAAAGILVNSQWFLEFTGSTGESSWRFAYLFGVLPALLVVWVRYSVKEPESFKKAQAPTTGRKAGSVKELLAHSKWGKHALLGMGLAAVGMASFWGLIVAGQDLAKAFLAEENVDPTVAAQKARFAYGFIQTFGAGIGLLSFGPICARLGRKKTFIIMHLGAFLCVPMVCYLPQNYAQLLWYLPIFGFFTLSIHAGYAIYFPELFPNHLRATGGSFCFNVGRLVSVPVLFFSGWLKADSGLALREVFMILGCVFLVGVAIVSFLPETKGQDLPE